MSMVLHCECLEHCATNSDVMAAMPGSAHVFRDHYCAGNQHGCARYKAYMQLGAARVPADLKPHEHRKLKELAL